MRVTKGAVHANRGVRPRYPRLSLGEAYVRLPHADTRVGRVNFIQREARTARLSRQANMRGLCVHEELTLTESPTSTPPAVVAGTCSSRRSCLTVMSDAGRSGSAHSRARSGMLRRGFLALFAILLRLAWIAPDSNVIGATWLAGDASPRR